MRYASFGEFYPYYLSEHRRSGTRRLHFAGTLLVLLTLGGVAARALRLPGLLQLLARALDNVEAVPSTLLSALDYVQLMFWPTPMIMLPADEPGSPDLNSFGPFTLATLGNAGLYAVLAGLTYLGVKRSRWLLALPVAVVAGIWYAVWST